MYERNASTHSYGMKETLSLIVDGDIDESKVCKTVPVNVKHNCTFIVNLSSLAHPNDLHADDCGSWKNNGVKLCITTWENKTATLVALGTNQCKTYRMKKNSYKVCRTYFVHSSHEDFRKVISVVYGMLWYVYSMHVSNCYINFLHRLEWQTRGHITDTILFHL